MNRKNLVALTILLVGLTTVYFGHPLEGALVCIIAAMHAE